MVALEEDNAEVAKLLLEIGYVAAGRGLQSPAESIFRGLEAIHPASELPWIGMAVAKMNGGDAESAVRLLREEALTRAPQSELAEGFLGLALWLAGYRAESVRTLQKVADSGQDPAAVAMARSLLANPPAS